jgi:cyclic-di-GMP phosphodiesterase TipF (flagellum assembly factor)
VLRRLSGKNREIGLFCNVSAATLVDPEFFPQFNEFADANRALAPSFVFEFRQDAYRTLGPMENESLAALAERGFRFSLDHVVDMRFEPRDLAERGFRFVKVPAALLLARSAAPGTDIHPADLSGLLGRYGIELIAERIETEATVVDLLDYDVKLGQGFLFSPPRPVRPEVLQGATVGDLAGVLETKPPAAAAPTTLAAALGLRQVGSPPPAGTPAGASATPPGEAAPAPAAAPAASTAPAPGTASAPGTAPAAGGTLPAVRQPERRAAGPSGGNPGTVLAQIARGMLARK